MNEATVIENQKGNIDFEIISPRFSVNTAEELRQGVEHLNEYGYAVFSNVLSNDEVNKSIDLLWKYLENLKAPYHIKRNDPQTWNKPWPGAAYVGVLNSHGIGQSELMWFVRGNPNIKKVFSQIWNSNELFVSFDGAGCFRDWNINPEWKTINAWYHCDQNPFEKPNRCSIQGLVSLTDSDETTGGLVVIPDSHKNFIELQSVSDKNRLHGDFVRIPYDYWLLKEFRPRLVKSKAGDLIVWDSRCIHCNTSATVSRERAIQPQLLRIAAYICMSPLSMFVPDTKDYKNLEEFRQLRENAVRNRITCTHWPLEIIPSGMLYDEKSPLKLNTFQRSLIIGTHVEPENETEETDY